MKVIIKHKKAVVDNARWEAIPAIIKGQGVVRVALDGDGGLTFGPDLALVQFTVAEAREFARFFGYAIEAAAATERDLKSTKIQADWHGHPVTITRQED